MVNVRGTRAIQKKKKKKEKVAQKGRNAEERKKLGL